MKKPKTPRNHGKCRQGCGRDATHSFLMHAHPLDRDDHDYRESVSVQMNMCEPCTRETVVVRVTVQAPPPGDPPTGIAG